MRLKPAVISIMAVVIVAPIGAARGQVAPVPVEAADLERRADLIGRTVVVDDHVAYYVTRTRNGGRRASVEADSGHVSGPQAAPSSRGAPAVASVVVRGVLKREGGRLDLRRDRHRSRPRRSRPARSRRSPTSRPRTSSRGRSWAAWAERRARDFKDNALLERAARSRARPCGSGPT